MSAIMLIPLNRRKRRRDRNTVGMEGNDLFCTLLFCFNALHPFEFLIRCSFSNYSMLPTYCAVFTPCRSTRRSPASRFPPYLFSVSLSVCLSLSLSLSLSLFLSPVR
ncbi:hypothetical protein XENORESO_004349 [Xenotaenia resolanae]|uniref:Transmembrane protein n=1 Tax=Xenotaenia resolanae TaxID=208358 RepID=A0ABV0WYE2_9TELE